MAMILWLILPIACMIGVAIYLYRKVMAAVTCFTEKWPPKRQCNATVIAALILIAPAVRIYGIWFIVLLHLTVLLMFTDGIVFIIKKVRKKKEWSKGWNRVYRSGVIAVILTALVIGYGRYNMFHVVRTEYTIHTQEDIRSEGYRLALLSDLHYGISMDDDQLQKAADRISAEEPDIVVLDGDIVRE